VSADERADVGASGTHKSPVSTANNSLLDAADKSSFVEANNEAKTGMKLDSTYLLCIPPISGHSAGKQIQLLSGRGYYSTWQKLYLYRGRTCIFDDKRTRVTVGM
jgi:hypothetical protein